MTTSTVPAVVTALVQVTTQTLTGWQVIDGPPLNNLKQQYALIGHNNDVASTGAAVETEQSIGDYAIANSFETYNIYNQLVAWTGGEAITKVREIVYDGLSAVSAMLETNSDLNGACMLAQLTSSALTLARGNNRVQASLTWVVNVQASRV